MSVGVKCVTCVGTLPTHVSGGEMCDMCRNTSYTSVGVKCSTHLFACFASNGIHLATNFLFLFNSENVSCSSHLFLCSLDIRHLALIEISSTKAYIDSNTEENRA